MSRRYCGAGEVYAVDRVVHAGAGLGERRPERRHVEHAAAGTHELLAA